jgi:hypothetical protein
MLPTLLAVLRGRVRQAGTEVPAPHQSVWSRNFSSGGHVMVRPHTRQRLMWSQVCVRVEPELQFRRTSYASASNSSCDSRSAAAPMFSSRCVRRDVPGMGSMTGDRCSSHASATCDGVAS